MSRLPFKCVTESAKTTDPLFSNDSYGLLIWDDMADNDMGCTIFAKHAKYDKYGNIILCKV